MSQPSVAVRMISAVLFSLVISFAAADFPINENVAYANAGLCARQCAAYQYGYNGYMLCKAYPAPASCLCAAEASKTMDYVLSLCPTSSKCGADAEATQAMAIFSAFCSVNLIGTPTGGAASTTAARTYNPTAIASTGLSPGYQLPTSTPTQNTSNNSGDSSGDSKSLSQSDKIAIGCAIAGAVVAVAIAIPGWLHMRRRRGGTTQEAQALHGPPELIPMQYHNQAQQPFLQPHQQHMYPQPYQHNNGWGGWK